MRLTTMARMLYKDFEIAGIEKKAFGGVLDFHALRTAFTNLNIKSGFDLSTSMGMARHSSASMTLETYGRANEERLRKATGIIGEIVEQAMVDQLDEFHGVNSLPSETLPIAVGNENLVVQKTYDESEWSEREDLNLRSLVPQTSALPG
jgi:hypothetical protein